MGGSIVQHSGASGTNNNTPSFNFSSTPTNGNYLLVVVTAQGITSNFVTSITIATSHNTFTRVIGSEVNNAVEAYIYQYNSSTDSNGIKFAFGGAYTNQAFAYVAIEMGGVTSGTADKTSTGSGSGSTASVTSVTPSAADVVIAAVSQVSTTGTYTQLDANLTNLDKRGSVSSVEVNTADNTNWPSSTSTTAGVTVVAVGWDEILVAFLTTSGVTTNNLPYMA